MRVFTYYTPLKGKSIAEEEALIELWKTSWQKAGWTPTILTPADLPRDTASAKMLRSFERKPTLTRRGLNFSCFARWLAIATQGGGFMSDYDVINYHFRPHELGSLTVYERHVPCLVSGTAEEFLRICKMFAEYRADRKDRVGWRLDTSDMKILIRKPETYIQRRDCAEFALPGWEEAAAVHFSNFAMRPRGFLPRYQYILRIRPI